MINFISVWRGIRAMTPKHGPVNYAVTFEWFGRAWCDIWTPVWHNGRGPYITIGLWFVRFVRGY